MSSAANRQDFTKPLSQNDPLGTHPCRATDREAACTSAEPTTEASGSEDTPVTPTTASAGRSSTGTEAGGTSATRTEAGEKGTAGSSSASGSSGSEASAANGYERLYDHLDATNGRAIGALIGHRKEPAETIAHKLEIRARILWDMAWAVGQGGPGIPVMRQRNVEWAADNLEAAAACIRRLCNFIPRTARDAANEEAVEKMSLALKMIRDGEHGESYSAGVAMSALASVEEMGLDV